MSVVKNVCPGKNAHIYYLDLANFYGRSVDKHNSRVPSI
jgi:hypothetical protein